MTTGGIIRIRQVFAVSVIAALIGAVLDDGTILGLATGGLVAIWGIAMRCVRCPNCSRLFFAPHALAHWINPARRQCCHCGQPALR